MMDSMIQEKHETVVEKIAGAEQSLVSAHLIGDNWGLISEAFELRDIAHRLEQIKRDINFKMEHRKNYM